MRSHKANCSNSLLEIANSFAFSANVSFSCFRDSFIFLTIGNISHHTHSANCLSYTISSDYCSVLLHSAFPEFINYSVFRFPSCTGRILNCHLKTMLDFCHGLQDEKWSLVHISVSGNNPTADFRKNAQYLLSGNRFYSRYPNP